MEIGIQFFEKKHACLKSQHLMFQEWTTIDLLLDFSLFLLSLAEASESIGSHLVMQGMSG